jgi:hypothetical protein
MWAALKKEKNMYLPSPDENEISRLWAAPLKRRTLLLALTASAIQIGFAGASFSALAEEPAFSFSAAGQPAADAFFRVSQILTGYTELDPHTSVRIAKALIDQQPAMSASLLILSDLVKDPGNTSSAQLFLSAAERVNQKEAALAVVAAWFKGTVGHGQEAVLVSYQQALMYRPVSDGLIVPTYCGNGPLWWTAPIPDATAYIFGPRTAV